MSEGAVNVMPASTHFIRDPRVLFLSLATAAVAVQKPLGRSGSAGSGTQGVVTNIPSQEDDDYEEDGEDMDRKDWMMAETDNGMLTEKQKMKSRVVTMSNDSTCMVRMEGAGIKG